MSSMAISSPLRPCRVSAGCPDWIRTSAYAFKGRCATSTPQGSVEHPEGIEPSCPAWKAGVLPLNHGCGLDGHNANGRSSSLRFAVPHVLRMMPPPRGDSEHAGHGNWWGSGELNPDCALIRRETGYKSVVLTIERLPRNWRRGWDSNPRRTCVLGGFQDRYNRPL